LRIPIINCAIEVKNLQGSKITDSSGISIIKNVPVGSQDIIFSQENYESYILNNLNVLPNKTVEFEVLLTPKIERINTINIGRKALTNSILNPISSYEFNREEISMNPGAQGDIFRAIGMLPGVSSSGGVYSAISVRGQGVRDNVYMVDDIPLTEVGHLEGNSFFNDPNGGRFSIFAPRVIEKAQFQGGGFGAEFGRRSASYLGLTIKEGNKYNLIVDGQVDLLGLNLNFDGPIKGLKNTTFFFSARYQNFLALVNVVGLKDIGLPRYGDFILKTTTILNKRNKLTGIFAVCPERYTRDLDHVEADKFLNLVYMPDFKRNKLVGGFNLSSQLTDRIKLKNVVYYTGYINDIDVGKAWPITDSLGNLTTGVIPHTYKLQSQNYEEHKLGFRSIFSFYLTSTSSLTMGVEADRMKLFNQREQYLNDTQYIYYKEDSPFGGNKFIEILPQFVNARFAKNASNLSTYISYSGILFSKFSFNAGLRYDYSGYSEQGVISPRLSGSYSIAKRHLINVSWGIYNQDPVYSDVADQVNGLLQLEKNTQLILGYKWTIQRNLQFTVEAWDKTFENLAVKPNPNYVNIQNTGVGYGRGIDLSIMLKMIRKIGGQLSYSFMESKRRDREGLEYYNFAFSQPHQFNILVNYKINSKWILSAKYRFATGKPSDVFIVHRNIFNDVNNYRYSKEITQVNGRRLPNFNSFDIRVNYNFRIKKSTYTMFFDIVNVRNKQIPNYENFNSFNGRPYFEGLAIFPTGGLKFEF
jgi:hypothetical protein